MIFFIAFLFIENTFCITFIFSIQGAQKMQIVHSDDDDFVDEVAHGSELNFVEEVPVSK